MNKRNLLITGGVAALSLALIALPAAPANSQTPCPRESVTARVAERLAQLQATLQGRQDEVAARLAEANSKLASSEMALAQHRQTLEQLEAFPALAGDDDDDGVSVLLDADGSSWLGVELHEVTGETAKELKLPAERGVVLSSIVPDSPAAKAGLKVGDRITAFRDEPVKSTADLLKHAAKLAKGDSAEITVDRGGKTETITIRAGEGL